MRRGRYTASQTEWGIENTCTHPTSIIDVHVRWKYKLTLDSDEIFPRGRGLGSNAIIEVCVGGLERLEYHEGVER